MSGSRISSGVLYRWTFQGTAKLRLDRVVTELVRAEGRETSRGGVQRWIESGWVRVGGVVVINTAQSISPGQTIDVDAAAETPTLSSAEPDATIQLSIVHDDRYLLVIEKPAGLVVHPARGHASGTLVNALLARDDFSFPRQPTGESDPEADPETDRVRPGIVHRLDKGTSGLLVVAKDPVTRERLRGLFAAHDIDREYVALAVGRVDSGTVDTGHGRSAANRMKFTSNPRGPSKRAVTHFRALEELGSATLVACTLETGRTHQIRVHLSEELGAPILGDPLYGRAPKDAQLRQLGESLGHQALHARVLGFVHPRTRKKMRWESPLPPDFASVVDALRA